LFTNRVRANPSSGSLRGVWGSRCFFTGDKKCVESWKAELKIGTFGREEGTDLLFQLVKEVVYRNRGVMKMKVDEKETKIYVVLEFPVERRTTLYYQNDNSFHLGWSPTGKARDTSIKYPPTPRLRRVIRLQRNPPKQQYFSS